MHSTEKPEITILGGGITGISAGYHAGLSGISNIVYEKSETPGGLVSNFEVEGFRFDKAIHLSFTKDEYVKKLFDAIPHYKHRPDAYCLENLKWLKHPVQNNLYPLSSEDKVSLVESFINRPSTDVKNYRDWLLNQYGDEICERYSFPYTRKYWGLEPEQLSLSWIGNRVRKADIKEVLSGAFEQKDENHYYSNEMRYPKQGGYYSFIKEIADSVNIKCEKEVIGISLVDKVIRFSGGEFAEYQSLINTLPLPIICQLIYSCPENVKKAAQELLWTTVDLVSVGLSKEDIPPYLWFYIYDSSNLAARGYSPSLKSPSNAPEGCSSLQFEIYNLSTNSQLDGNNLKENIRSELIASGICKKEDILFLHHRHLPYGNVVFDIGMESRRKIVLDYLKENDIISCGRFGEWDYLWSDQSFLSGKHAISNLLDG